VVVIRVAHGPLGVFTGLRGEAEPNCAVRRGDLFVLREMSVMKSVSSVTHSLEGASDALETIRLQVGYAGAQDALHHDPRNLGLDVAQPVVFQRRFLPSSWHGSLVAVSLAGERPWRRL
jgi:hypothetical protein